MQRRLSSLTRRHVSDSNKWAISTRATRSSSSNQPPGNTNQLDKALQKAAKKVKLAHPAAQPVKHLTDKDTLISKPTLASQGRKQEAQPQKPAKQRPTKQSHSQREDAIVDDGELFSGITEQERDDVWAAIAREVEGDSSSGDDDGNWNGKADGPNGKSVPAQRRMAPGSARADDPSTSSRSEPVPQPVASTSGFKGFGSPPARNSNSPTSPSLATSRSRPASASAPPATPPPPAPPTQPTSSRHATASQQPSLNSKPAVPVATSNPAAAAASTSAAGAGPGSSTRRTGPLRVFLFNAEEGLTRSLLQELGLAARVQVVSELRGADLILAAKLARSGKHVNLTQGERTAANAGIPFVVVGRNMTAVNLRAAVEPLLDLDPQAAAALVAARAAAARTPSSAEVYAHGLRMAQGFFSIKKPAGPAPEGRS